MIKPEDYLQTNVNSQVTRMVTEQVDYNKYLSLGWHPVSLSRPPSKQKEKEIINWMKNNCREKYFFIHKDFLFEDEKDAILFTLRWI